MTTQEKLTKIEEVIRECCPELQWQPGWLGIEEWHREKIHLEHILRAIGNTENIRCSLYNVFKINSILEIKPFVYYYLTLPLHLQSDEFISWLYETLCSN